MSEQVIIKRKPGRPPKRIVPDSVEPVMAGDMPEAFSDAQQNSIDDMRVEMRAEVREEDPREAAAKRAREILEHLGDSFDQVDEYNVKALEPPGWTYEWKMHSVGNMEDTGYINACLSTGWQYVPPTRKGHHVLVPKGWKESYILKKGMALMERPQEITDLVNKRMLREAQSAIRVKDDQLNSKLGSHYDRSNKGNQIGVGLKRTIEGPIPNN